MTPDNFAQAPSHTIAHDGGADPLGSNDTGAKRCVFFRFENTQDQQCSASGLAFSPDTREFGGTGEPTISTEGKCAVRNHGSS